MVEDAHVRACAHILISSHPYPPFAATPRAIRCPSILGGDRGPRYDRVRGGSFTGETLDSGSGLFRDTFTRVARSVFMTVREGYGLLQLLRKRGSRFES